VTPPTGRASAMTPAMPGSLRSLLHRDRVSGDLFGAGSGPGGQQPEPDHGVGAEVASGKNLLTDAGSPPQPVGSMIDLRPVRNTSLIEITVQSDTPEEAQQLANEAGAKVTQQYRAFEWHKRLEDAFQMFFTPRRLSEIAVQITKPDIQMCRLCGTSMKSWTLIRTARGRAFP